MILCNKLEEILEDDLDEICKFLQKRWDENLDGDMEPWDCEKSARLKRVLKPDSFFDRFWPKCAAGDSSRNVTETHHKVEFRLNNLIQVCLGQRIIDHLNVLYLFKVFIRLDPGSMYF